MSAPVRPFDDALATAARMGQSCICLIFGCQYIDKTIHHLPPEYESLEGRCCRCGAALERDSFYGVSIPDMLKEAEKALPPLPKRVRPSDE